MTKISYSKIFFPPKWINASLGNVLYLYGFIQWKQMGKKVQKEITAQENGLAVELQTHLHNRSNASPRDSTAHFLVTVSEL